MSSFKADGVAMALPVVGLVAISKFPPGLLAGLALLCLAVAALTATRVYTTVRYRVVLAQHAVAASATESKAPRVLSSPQLPYTLPFLGNALAFLTPVPGDFWAYLFARHPRLVGACSLYLGGRTLHALLSPTAAHALLRHRTLARVDFNVDIQTLAFGSNREDSDRYLGFQRKGPNAGRITTGQRLEEMNHLYLLRADRVNELTDHFMRRLREELQAPLPVNDEKESSETEATLALYDWLWPRMFTASTVVFMVTELIEIYTDLPADFRAFDAVVVRLFFGLPRFVVPEAFARRERCLAGLRRWLEVTRARCGGVDGATVDPDGPVPWEPRYGSRTSRGRQRYYAERDLSLPGRASLELGFLFGLASNAIPATGWLLCHVLDPRGDPTVLPRLRAEVESVQLRDGVPDVGALCALPLLQSAFAETLRLYVDIFIARNVQEDMVLPLDEEGRRAVQLRKGDVVFAPTWVGHRDAQIWDSPAPAHTFHAERFLTRDPVTGRDVFSTAGTVGKLFPFGGGKGYCPGRSFAKQEVLGAVAMLLLTYDFEFVEFLDHRRQPTEKFVEFKNAMSGSGVIALGGDMRVKMRRRKATSS